jgi:hypothetical protein
VQESISILPQDKPVLRVPQTALARFETPVRFTVQGFQRAYRDFYVGFGLFVTVFLLFSAVLAWQFGGAARDVLVRIPAATWGLAACFVLVTIMSWRYFFVVPGILSTLIALCLVIAAWLTGRG